MILGVDLCQKRDLSKKCVIRYYSFFYLRRVVAIVLSHETGVVATNSLELHVSLHVA
jgi:hypothetical protein